MTAVDVQNWQRAAEIITRQPCACGYSKPSRTAVCRRCYRLLPASLRSALYKHASEGFCAAYDAAIRWLHVNSDVFLVWNTYWSLKEGILRSSPDGVFERAGK
jgi:hypothetical protein